MPNFIFIYLCDSRCPVYNNLPSNQCYLVKADGQCCSQPMCYDPNKQQVVNPLNGGSFPVVGTYGGGFTGFRPNVNNPTTGGSRGIFFFIKRISENIFIWVFLAK